MSEERIARLNREIVQLSQAGHYERALEVARRAFDLSRELFGNEHSAVTEALKQLGELHRRKGDYRAAKSMYEQVLEIQRKTLSREDPNIAESLIDLAMANEDVGHTAAALPLYREALDIRRKALPAGDPLIAYCMSNLALTHHKLGEPAVGMPLLREAHDILCKALGPTHPHVATNLSNQSALQQRMDNNVAAKELLNEALDIRRKVFPEPHPAIVTSLRDLAMIHCAMGDHAAGLSLLQEALEVARKAELGHPRIADILGKLAGLYHKMGDDVTSSQLLHEALEIKRKAFPAGHPSIANSLRDLAAFYANTGNPHLSEKYLREVLEIQTRILPKEHPEVNRNLHYLYKVYLSMGLPPSTIDKLLEPFRYTSPSSVEQVSPLPEASSEVTAAGPVPGGLGARLPVAPHVPPDAIDAAHTEDEDSLIPKVLEHASRIEDPLTFATMMRGAALCYRARGRYLQALPPLEQALRIRQMMLGPGDPSVLATQHDLGVLYLEAGRYRDAEMLLRGTLEEKRVQQALAIQNGSIPDPSTLAVSLHGLALVYRETGRYGDALLLLEEALQIWQKTLPPDDGLVITARNELGVLYSKLGRYADAETLLRGLLEPGGNLPVGPLARAANLHALGHVYNETDRCARALPLLEEALEIRRGLLPDLHPDIAATLSALATSYQALGRHADAEQLLREALEVEKVVGPNPLVAQSLHNLAVLYQRQGRLHESIDLAERAIKLGYETLGTDHPYLSIARINLASLYGATGRANKAETLLKDIVKEHRMHNANDLSIAAAKNALAVLCEAQNRHTEAEELYHDSLDMIQGIVGEDHHSCALVMDNLSALLIRTGRPSEALQLSLRSSDIYDLFIDQAFAGSSEQQKLTALQSIRIGFDVLLTVLTKTHSPKEVEAGFKTVLRRKGIIAETLATQRDAILAGAHPELAGDFHKLMDLRLETAKRYLAGPGSEGLEYHQQTLTGLIREREKLEMDLSRNCVEVNLSRRLTSADREAVCAKLPVNGALIEFVKFDRIEFARDLNSPLSRPGYLAFIIVADESKGVAMIDLGDAQAIDGALAKFRNSIGGGGRHFRPQRKERSDGEINWGSALRSLVFDPLLTHLAGRTRLFLAPDGELTRLPFEVLPTADGRRLIDDYLISYLSSGRDVLRFGTPTSGPSGRPMVVAGPDFDLGADAELSAEAEVAVAPGRRSHDLDRSGNLHFERLHGAQEEGERIAGLLGVEPLLGPDALEATVKMRRSPRILHLATHGLFLPDQPREPNAGSMLPIAFLANTSDWSWHLMRLENPLLRSLLALAGANTWLRGGRLPKAAEDGMLSAEDASGLDLLSTDLVVLSACETALGSVHVGEGVFGLQRAFVLAGAKTLVMSQWQVPDAETQELMEKFYGHILAGKGRAEALRFAQLALKTKHLDNTACWGAFICLGDPGPLDWSSPATRGTTTGSPT
jgi:tetratricopeptide (TPR) repeat protein/CHAT domain-containing protein